MLSFLNKDTETNLSKQTQYSGYVDSTAELVKDAHRLQLILMWGVFDSFALKRQLGKELEQILRELSLRIEDPLRADDDNLEKLLGEELG
jgi:hypothetical protein